MRATRLARALTLVAAFASTAGASAQPPLRARRGVPAATLRSQSPIAIAYMSGKQPLVGPHAGSGAAVQCDETGRPMLALTTLNRGESLTIPAAGDDGGFASADLDRVAHLLRAATGDEHPVDPRVLSLVYRIETSFHVPEVRIVSGYRLPRPGSRSNHCKGRAMDIIVPGIADEEVARFARETGFAGVGVYPTSQFVHVDVRPRSYFWVDYSGPHMRNRERGILGELAAKSDALALARGQVPIEPFGVATNVDAALQARGMNAPATSAPEEEEDEE
ncbi:MAG: DUF882 domain-containing protein [Myxococcota bacterium]|nr:DUF882 domain-containing protein [Myxococcota bacterium]